MSPDEDTRDPLTRRDDDDEDFLRLLCSSRLEYRCRVHTRGLVVDLYAYATEWFRVLRYAWENTNTPGAFDPIAPNSICHFQRHLLAKAKSAKRYVTQERQRWRSEAVPSDFTPGLLDRLSKPIEVARVLMCTVEVTFWMDRADALGPALFGSAQHSRDGVSEARRAERQAKEDLIDANRAMLRVGGSEDDLPFQYTDACFHARMTEEIKAQIATWLSDQEKAGKARVTRLVTRAIVSVKRCMQDEAAVDAYRASVARIVASRSSTPTPSAASASPPPSPSLPPSPTKAEREAAARATRERAAASLAAVRKANAAVAKKFALVEEARAREAKEREAKERYAGKGKRAAEARARDEEEKAARKDREERARWDNLFPEGIDAYRRELELEAQRAREAEAEAERQRLARLEHERATARLAEAAKRLEMERATAAAAELAADLGKRAELKRRLGAWAKFRADAAARREAAESKHAELKRRLDAWAKAQREKADAKEKAKFEKQERKRAGAVENECAGWTNFARYIARRSTEDEWYPPGSPAGVLVSNGITRLLAAVVELRRAEREYAAVDKEHFRASMEVHTLAVQRRQQAMDAFNSLNALANARFEAWAATQRNLYHANRHVPVPIHNARFEAEVAAQRQHAELCMQAAMLAGGTAVMPPLPPEP